MTKISYLPYLLLMVALTACEKESVQGEQPTNIDNKVTETVLDDVDNIEGTISDAMINVEDLDNSEPEEVVEDGNNENEIANSEKSKN